MPTNNSSISAIARLFRNLPAETVKAIEDVEDEFSAGGESAITSKEANTGPSEGMRGGNASSMIRSHSDLDGQRGRMAEYDAFSNILSDIAKAMKAQTEALAALAPKAKTTVKSVDGELSYLAVAEKALKKAKAEIFKAETEVEAEEDSTDDRVSKAERLVTKAAELLAKAEDDDEDDKDEDRVEKARATVRKLTKALKPFKDAAIVKAAKIEADAAVVKAAADKAAADALVAVKADDKKDPEDKKDEDEKETAKSALEASVAALQNQFGMVTKSVTEVMEMVSGLSRGAKQPNFVAKAVAETKTDEPVDFTARAEEAADNGRISNTELMKCHNVISRLTIAKSGTGGVMNDMAAVKADLTAASSGVREVFASLLTA